MKEKTVDTEGHRDKVGLDQQKSISSSSSAKIGSSPKSNLSPTQSKSNSTNSKGPFLAPAPNNSSNTPTNNNFDDDFNEWDISLGDLIIDLDADIEREGDKSLNVCVEKNEAANSLLDSENSTVVSSDQNKILDLGDSSSVMSSNLKSSSSRLSSISSSGNSASAQSNNTVVVAATTTTVSPTISSKNNNLTNVLPVSPNTVSSTNGGSVGHIHHFHHGQNQRNNNPSPSTPNIIPPNSNSVAKNAIEHHSTVDKGLKMKIKRKSIGGKNSETKHEIVSSDLTLQTCKPIIGTIDAINSTPNIATSTVQTQILGPTSTVLNSPNSVITANSDGVLSPIGDLSASSKSSKHSNKNKSAHRDKKDKIKPDKDRLSLPVNSNPIKPQTSVEENAVSASPPSSQSVLPNVTLKYSTLSPTVMLKSSTDEANKNPITPLTKSEDNISETKETGTSTSVATITEPDSLGPCEPGTSVTLEGIVWQETEGGVLVVNVTWRGKTYVGTLLDCTKHDWAPPRFCESPTSDIESKSIKNTRGKRARTNFVADNPIDTRSVTSKLRNGKGRRTTNSGFVPPSPAKSDSSVNSSKRKGRPSDLDLSSVDDSIKRNRISKLDLPDGQQPTSPVLIECPEPNCSKKYKHINGLKYHQSHAHFGSSYNINDSQDNDNNTESTALNSAKGDGSDVEYMDDTPNMTDSPNKDIDIEDKFNSDTVNDSNENTNRSDNSVMLTSNDNNNNNNTQNHNSQETDAKMLPNSANELQVLQNLDCLTTVVNNDQTGENVIVTTCTNNNSNSNELSNNNNNFTDLVTDSGSLKKKLTEANSVFVDSINNNHVNSIINSSIHQSSNEESPDIAKCKLISPPLNDIDNNNKPDDIENVASPAYSDISDDTETNGNANELAKLSSSQTPSIEVKCDQPTSEIKKLPSSTKMNLNPFPPYFPQSQYLAPNNSVDSKLNEPKSVTDSKDLIAEKHPENSNIPNAYPQYPFYNFGSIPPHDSKYGDNVPKCPNNSKAILSPPNINKGDSDSFIENTNKPPLKDNSDFNSSKQIPIVELQNLKNRIPNFAFDQGSHFDTQKPRYLADNEREKSKDKMKHSPQLPKTTSFKDKDDKEKKNKVQDEGVKPTMETTGPPPPTNGYYYNPSYLGQFPPISPFDSMFRGSAMNQMVMSPYGSPPPYLHSQMRFPPMGSIESLSMPRNSSVSRSTTQLSSSGASSSSTTVKTTSHHLSSYNQNSKPPDRTSIMSPSSASSSIPSSYSLITSPSYHKSPNKPDYTGSINQSSNHNLPLSMGSDHRPLMTSAPSGLHGPRPHPLHSNPHGYPMFDPFSAMIHTSNNSVPMHQFTPK